MMKASIDQTLPDFIQSIVLNLECGASLEKSISSFLGAQEGNPTYDLLILEYERSESSLNAVNAYAKTVNTYFFWRFTQQINQLHSTGSQASIEGLKTLYQEIWRYKHENLKIASERISVILTFILMLSLISVIIIVVSPILMNFMIF